MTRRSKLAYFIVALVGAPVAAQTGQTVPATPGTPGAPNVQPPAGPATPGLQPPAGPATLGTPSARPPVGPATPGTPGTQAPAGQARAIDPRADRTVRQMSDYLASLQTFRVVSTAIDEVVTQDGQKVQSVSQSRIAVQRPNRLRSDRLGPVADIEFHYDGRNFGILGHRTGYYAMAPAPPTIDAAIDALRERLGIDIPAGDLLNSQPYNVLMSDVRSGQYLGVEPIDGVPTHHLAFRTDTVDWQVWVQDGQQPVPRRLVITSRNEPQAPEFTAEMSNWEPNARVSDSDFVFQPPRGARRIEFLPVGGRTSGQGGGPVQ